MSGIRLSPALRGVQNMKKYSIICDNSKNVKATLKLVSIYYVAI